MASAIVAMVLLLASSSAMAMQFMVGDTAGWSIPSKSNVNYTDWVMQHRYHVGDSLVFNFDKDTHSVLEVNRQDFNLCNTASPIAEYKNVSSVVHLSAPGPHWFISGDAGQCSQGQKFGIMVVQKKGGHHRALAPAPAPASSLEIRPPAMAPTSGAVSRVLLSSTMVLAALVLVVA